MGQKVHPSGFRVGITKKHQSQWFARFNKNKYSQTVFEDRMIRDTLHKLFPELLNPISKSENKRDQNAKIKKSQITQIKIERSIVPYEIGIQIHAENCKLLKSAIKNLQVKREIIVKLQKTRQYLTNLKTKLDNLTNKPSTAFSLLEPKFKTGGNRNIENNTKKQDGPKLSRIKSLRKKLAKIIASNTQMWGSSSRKKLSKDKFGLAPAFDGKAGLLKRGGLGRGWGLGPSSFSGGANRGFFLQSQGEQSKTPSGFAAQVSKPTNPWFQSKTSSSKKIRLSKRSLSKLFKLKLLRAKLAKLTQIKTKRKIQIVDSTSLNRGTFALEGKKQQIGFKRKAKLRAKLTKRQLKRQRIFKKRLRLRKFIRLRDRLSISKGLLIQKKGPKIIQKLLLSPTPQFLKDFSLNPKVYLLPVQKIEKIWLLRRQNKMSSFPLALQEEPHRGKGDKNPYGERRETPLSTKKNLNTKLIGPCFARRGEITNQVLEENLLKKRFDAPSSASKIEKRFAFINPPTFAMGQGPQTPAFAKQGRGLAPLRRTQRGKEQRFGEGIKKNKSNPEGQTNIFNSRLQKKIVTMYIEQMKRKFLPHLNDLFLQYTNQTFPKNGLSLGYLKKWDFNLRTKYLKTQPIEKLNRLIQNLREKFVLKLNGLRKEFLVFGSFSWNSSEILGLFQLYNFVINLKDLVNDLKRNLKHSLKTRLAISKMGGPWTSTFINSKEPINANSAVWPSSKELFSPPLAKQPLCFVPLLRKGGGRVANQREAEHKILTNENIMRPNKLKIIDSEVANALVPKKVFRKKLDNISNECRKMKFIEYLKDLVKKHRTANIYLYLASISESRKKLKEIKNELKENLDFYLPGTNSLKNLIETRKNESSSDSINLIDSKINEQVNKVLLKLAKKHPYDKTFSEFKLEELNRRKTMWLQNLQLTPKISIKFFSVNPKTLNQKASVISESVVDALEKRKAFRKVIKSTKEKLMRNPEIKGVKIQVAGRLNGAEIARTEWVRAGRVPLQTLRANLDYSYRTANTIYGIIGIKVWIFKGFTKLISKQ